MDSKEPRDWRNVPVYNLSLAHARKKGEEETFRASSEANNLCSKRIREALDSQRQGSIPMKECLLSLIRDFGWERVLYLLANSIQIAQGDLRISPDNTKWANEYRITPNLPKNEIDWRYLWDIRGDRARLDAFVTFTRSFESRVHFVEKQVAKREGAKEENMMRNVPLYKESASTARANNELNTFIQSNTANQSCAKDIEQAIADHWDGSRLSNGCALPLLEKYGEERFVFVLANTLQLKQHDGRFSKDNMAWAQAVKIEPTPREQPSERRYSWEIKSHPVKLDQFVEQARQEIEAISIRELPVYYEPVAYAMENGEMGPYWNSFHYNVDCAKELTEAIADHYDGYRLQAHAADAVLKKYGQERTLFVLANTIQLMRDDGRVSQANIQWADTIPIPHGTPDDDSNRRHFCIREHPGLFDLFVKITRKEIEEQSRLPLAEQLKRVMKEHTAPTHKEPKSRNQAR